MPKLRGPYKRYLYDENVSIPERTRYDHLSQIKKKALIDNNQFLINNQDNSPKLSAASNLITTPIVNQHHHVIIEYDNNQQPPASTLDNTSIVNQHDDDDVNEQTIVNDENEDDYSINDENDDSFTESDIDLNLNETGAVNKEELAAAFLASFYSGRTTQTSLKDYLELSNIYSSIKLPTSFDGLSNILFKNKKKFIHKKIWYCGVCLKKFSNEQIKNRTRSCETCKTR
jgi:hypothetical protein